MASEGVTRKRRYLAVFSPGGIVDPALQDSFFLSVYRGDIEAAKSALKQGAVISAVDDAMGLSALHLAVGRDDLAMTKLLVDNGATFGADKQGRWPSTIAAECEVSDELCDYIANAESEVTDA